MNIDEVFKTRFIEEISKVANPKDKVTKIRLACFALLSYALAVGSTFGAVELLMKALLSQKSFNLATFVVDFSVIIIMSGFAVTFLLTFVIFLLAYSRNVVIKKCLPGYSYSVSKRELSPGAELHVNLKFGLTKRELKDVRLKLFCDKNIQRKVLDVESVMKEVPHADERVLGENLTPQSAGYDYNVKLVLPEDALMTQRKLSKDHERITWGVRVYFNFAGWHTYEENISIIVK